MRDALPRDLPGTPTASALGTPGTAAARVEAGNAFVRVGKLPEAVSEFEAAARLAPRSTAILNALARLYLDPQVRRPSDALRVTRLARGLEPWREETYYLEARAHEGMGEQAAARRTFELLVRSFPAGAYHDPARLALERLSSSTYEVALNFRFENRGAKRADRIRLRVQSARSFHPYSEARLLESPSEATGRELDDGTRYFGFEPFALGPGEARTFTIRYAVRVAAEAYAAGTPLGDGETPTSYIEASPFIESDAPEIVSLSRSLASAGGTAEDRARRFYNFVVKRLTYVVQPATHGALSALSDPSQADCTEFAALFIALNRAAGIPARPVFGYLYEPEKATYQISHLWAEFWQEGAGWISADPTNGTLELNRYFGRAESNAIPLWVPHPSFGDLAGVRVSYQSPGQGDTLFTELVTEIRRTPSADFESAAATEIPFTAAGLGDLDGSESHLPLGPMAALFAAAFGVRFWLRRDRSA